jgi:hypothetical protein
VPIDGICAGVVAEGGRPSPIVAWPLGPINGVANNPLAPNIFGLVSPTAFTTGTPATSVSLRSDTQTGTSIANLYARGRFMYSFGSEYRRPLPDAPVQSAIFSGSFFNKNELSLSASVFGTFGGQARFNYVGQRPGGGLDVGPTLSASVTRGLNRISYNF